MFLFGGMKYKKEVDTSDSIPMLLACYLHLKEDLTLWQCHEFA
jgi:hypothetical protein